MDKPIDIGDAKLRADLVEGANESGLPSLIAGIGVADEGIDGLYVLLEAVGHAPNGVGEDTDGAGVLPDVLSIDGRRRRGHAARDALLLGKANGNLAVTSKPDAARIGLNALGATHVHRPKDAGEAHGSAEPIADGAAEEE